jgi:hypothetical protein
LCPKKKGRPSSIRIASMMNGYSGSDIRMPMNAQIQSNPRFSPRSRTLESFGLGSGGGSLGSIWSHWITSLTGRRPGSSQRTVGPMMVAPASTVRPAPTHTGPMNLAPATTLDCASRQTTPPPSAPPIPSGGFTGRARSTVESGCFHVCTTS